MVSELTRQVLIAGTSAARQRRELRRRGRLTDVVDQLIAETAGRWPNAAAAVGEDPTLLFGYHRQSSVGPRRRNAAVSYDEAVDPAAGRGRLTKRSCTPSPISVWPRCGRGKRDIEQEQRADNITFRVKGQSSAQLFPVDLMPRLVAADEWAKLTVGSGSAGQGAQRVPADIYSEQAIIADGVIGLQALDRAPGFRSTGRLCGGLGARPHQRHRPGMRPGRKLDGARGQPPHPVGHRLRDRQQAAARPSTCPSSIGRPTSATSNGCPAMLLDTLRASAPLRCSDEPAVALLSAGWEDSAWFEHTFLAEEMGIALVRSIRPVGAGRKTAAPHRFRVYPVDVLYARMDEDMLFSSTGYDGARCGRTCSRRSPRDADHRQRARQRRRRRQGHLRVRSGDDRVLPRREALAGPGADVDLRRTRPA